MYEKCAWGLLYCTQQIHNPTTPNDDVQASQVSRPAAGEVAHLSLMNE
jgi:hypothetical protein